MNGAVVPSTVPTADFVSVSPAQWSLDVQGRALYLQNVTVTVGSGFSPGTRLFVRVSATDVALVSRFPSLQGQLSLVVVAPTPLPSPSATPSLLPSSSATMSLRASSSATRSPLPSSSATPSFATSVSTTALPSPNAPPTPPIAVTVYPTVLSVSVLQPLDVTVTYTSQPGTAAPAWNVTVNVTGVRWPDGGFVPLPATQQLLVVEPRGVGSSSLSLAVRLRVAQLSALPSVATLSIVVHPVVPALALANALSLTLNVTVVRDAPPPVPPIPRTANSTVVRARLDAPASVSQCTPLVLDASSSSVITTVVSAGGEATQLSSSSGLAWSWSVASASPCDPGRLQSLLSGLPPAAVLVVPAGLLPDACVFTVAVDVSHAAVGAAATATATVSVSSQVTPTLAVDGGPVRRSFVDEAIVLTAVLRTPTDDSCNVVPVSAVAFTWALVTASRLGGVTTSGYVVPTPPLPSSVASSGRLALPSGCLAVGGSYLLSVSATAATAAGVFVSSSTVEVQVQTREVQAAGASLVAGIAGGAFRVVSAVAPVVLNASVSVDRDGVYARITDAVFVWSCQTSSGGSCPAAVSAGAMASPSAVVVIPAGSLPPGEYQFTVNVTAGVTGGLIPYHHRFSTASARVAVLPAVSTSVSIVRPASSPLLAVPGQRVVLEGVIVPAGADDGTHSSLPGVWTQHSPDASSYPARLLLTSLPATVVLLSSSLSPGRRYVFTLTPRGDVDGASAADGNASVTVLVNTPPFGGVVDVAPRAGVELVTRFTLSSSQWTAPLEVRPCGRLLWPSLSATVWCLGVTSLCCVPVFFLYAP